MKRTRANPAGPTQRATAPTVDAADLREIARWSVACAERVLPLFAAKAPQDPRPGDAIAAARVFAGGGPRTAQLRSVGWAAHAAAGEVGDPAAAAAACAASAAAGAAYTHPIATPHQINHVLAAAAYGALASEAAVGASGDATGDAFVRWALAQASPALRRVVKRMPGRVPGKGRLANLYYQLDVALRGGRSGKGPSRL